MTKLLNAFTAARVAAGKPKPAPAVKKAATVAAKLATAAQRDRQLADSLALIDKVLAGGRVRQAPASGSLGDILRQRLAAGIAKRAPESVAVLFEGFAVKFDQPAKNAAAGSGLSITKAAISEALPGFQKRGAPILAMHRGEPVGEITSTVLLPDGLWVVGRIDDEATAKKAREGVFKGLSIGFSFNSRRDLAGSSLQGLDLTEISLADTPAQAGCRINIIEG